MTARFNALVVDDDPGIRRLLRLEFASQSIEAVIASSAAEAMEQSKQKWPDIAVLDVRMPDVSGLRLMTMLRAERPLPTILLTAKGSETDIARGLDAGADDYVTKPFAPDELVARMRAVLRRSPFSRERQEHIVRKGDLEVNLTGHTVTIGGSLVPLTSTEWAVLRWFVTHPERVLNDTTDLRAISGRDTCDERQRLRVWIARLRRKLESTRFASPVIRTVATGYVLDSSIGGQPETTQIAG